MDEKKEAKEKEDKGFWGGFAPTAIGSLHWSLRYFVELKPWRSGSEQWVQPLSEAFQIVLERLHHVRAVANLTYEYLPTYSCWVHGYEPCDTSLIIRSASFFEEDVLRVDVVGEGWESHKWSDKWSKRDQKVAYDMDQEILRNFCGVIIHWSTRSSTTPGDPGSNYFQVREQRENERERARWIQDDKQIHANCHECKEDPDKQAARIAEHMLLIHLEDNWLNVILDEMLWEARHWNRVISGSDNKTDVVAPLLSRSTDIPPYRPLSLRFRYNGPDSVPDSQLLCHADNDRDQVHLHLIHAELFVSLPPSTLVTHQHAQNPK